MSYYTLSKDRQKDLDYDYISCLENNPLEEVDIESTAKILAIYEGQNDGDSWRWIVERGDGGIVFVEGWCDYTGWDCQSGAFAILCESAESACRCALECDRPDEDVYDTLMKQVVEGVKETWRKKKDVELDIANTPVWEPELLENLVYQAVGKLANLVSTPTRTGFHPEFLGNNEKFPFVETQITLRGIDKTVVYRVDGYQEGSKGMMVTGHLLYEEAR